MIWPSRRALITGAVVVALVVLVAAAGTLWYVTTQRTAAAAYAEALAQVQGSRTSNTPETKTAVARQLEATLAQYPASRLAGDAAYELANLRFADRQYGAARNAYGIALARGAPTIRTLARAGFEELSLDLGRTQELAGRRERAIETYRRLLKEAPKTRRADEIRIRLASLGAAP